MKSAEHRSHEIVSTTAEMRDFIERVSQKMAIVGYVDKEVFAVRLGLEEAIVNAIKHGNRMNPKKKVSLRYAVDHREVVVEIQDEGAGFNPSELPDPLAPENLERPCGRGVFLIKSYMSWVKYNDKGNCVTVCKKKSK